MTKEAFVANILDLAPWSNVLFTTAKTSLPEVCKIVAIKCFIDKQPEDDRTEALREQLLNLRHYGQFRFDSDPDPLASCEGIIIR